MLLLFILWLLMCLLTFGFLGSSYALMRKASSKPWRLKIDKNYRPKISIIIPTYNESSVIHFKLENLSKVEYPRELMQVIIADSNSSDTTLNIINDFVRQHPNIDVQVMVEKKLKGKSAALNMALRNCTGEIVIVSDADCFWHPDILNKALPYLADANVGAISGTKILLNSQQSWVTRAENNYLRSMNLLKLGESKSGSTLFFEGGFSAYKKEVLESFDPYQTGSDDCGTIIRLIEKGTTAILVPEAQFFTTFPATWRGRILMKVRRGNQIVRVFMIYASLLAQKRVKTAKKIVMQGVFQYLFCPMVFILLGATTIALLLSFPYFGIILLVLLIPKVGLSLLEVIQNYVLLLISIFSLVLSKKFLFWNKPEDRVFLTETVLRDFHLI